MQQLTNTSQENTFKNNWLPLLKKFGTQYYVSLLKISFISTYIYSIGFELYFNAIIVKIYQQRVTTMPQFFPQNDHLIMDEQSATNRRCSQLIKCAQIFQGLIRLSRILYPHTRLRHAEYCRGQQRLSVRKIYPRVKSEGEFRKRKIISDHASFGSIETQHNILTICLPVCATCIIQFLLQFKS